MKILCFGDSITFGEIDVSNGGWADWIKRDYIRQFANTTRQEIGVYNLGVCGETTDGLVARFEIEFNARAIKGQKSLAILSYGANDIVIHKDKNIVPIEYYIRNLKRCIQHVQLNKGQVIVASLTPIDPRIDGKRNQHDKLRFNKDIEAYNSALQALAKETESLYLDIYQEFILKYDRNLLSGDGLHPNERGHQVIYQTVKAMLEKIIIKSDQPEIM